MVHLKMLNILGVKLLFVSLKKDISSNKFIITIIIKKQNSLLRDKKNIYCRYFFICIYHQIFGLLNFKFKKIYCIKKIKRGRKIEKINIRLLCPENEADISEIIKIKTPYIKIMNLLIL